MPESSIVILADPAIQNRYRDLGIDKESLNIFSLRDAPGILERLKANVVLIDCGVNPRKGLKLLKEIKSLHSQIPVIFITDVSSEDLAIAAFRSGAREYYVNPANRVILKKTIRRLVAIREKTAETRRPFGPFLITDLEAGLDFDKGNIPLRLQEVLVYIDDCLTNKLTLSSLAERIRLSKYHFSRYFRKHTGKSPMKYVNFVRLKRAKDLLGRKDLTVTEIAHQVGYADLNAFIRHFKKETGMTPTEVRNGRGRDDCGER